MTAKRTVILGGSESGTGAAILAIVRGHDVFLSDSGSIKTKYKDLLQAYEIDFEENKHSQNVILSADEIIKSPGIPETAEIMQAIRNEGISVLSETEFAYRYCDGKIVAITGSNGKTTTTLLTHHIFRKAEMNAGLAGNVGYSFAYQVATQKHDYYILEISSFQLDDSYEFAPDIAVLLNITPDHMDRYGNSMKLYTESKFRIAQNLRSDQYFVYCADDEIILDYMENNRIGGTHIPFSIYRKCEENGAYLTDNQITINIHNKNTFNMIIEKLALQGKHNLYDSMAAAITARLSDIKSNVLKESLSDFVNAEHRLESVARVHGIEFINDSKATNVNSTWYALESVNAKVIWIAGGQDKGNDYSFLTDLVRDKVKAIICLGVDNTKIKKSFKGIISEIYETTSMWEAVNAAYRLGAPEDVVLLSPACASFDLYENFEDRGNQFKNAVRNL
jgi:UDP-N-acetylmuramoylalanine--D-glutamate ligase